MEAVFIEQLEMGKELVFWNFLDHFEPILNLLIALSPPNTKSSNKTDKTTSKILQFL